MLSDQKKLWLEEYKELGIEVRQFNSETYATNRLMLPPLVIGLLVLYGEVEKFLGVEIKNPDAVHQLVLFGCVMISLIWICNVSRLAQLSYLDRATIRQREYNLGLKGHGKIYAIDEKMVKDLPVTKILRHSGLRLVGFGTYFFLLLHFMLKSMDFIKVPSLLIGWHDVLILLFAILGGGGMSFLIWRIYFKGPSSSSGETPVKCQHIASEENSEQEQKKRKSPMKFLSIVLLVLCSLLLFLFIINLISFSLDLQVSSHTYLIRGMKYSAKGNYDKAIEAYTRAIEMKVDYASAYALRAEAYRTEGKNNLSSADWTKAKEIREDK